MEFIVLSKQLKVEKKMAFNPNKETPFSEEQLIAISPEEKPQTIIQTLMQGVPGKSIEDSYEQTQTLRETVMDCIDRLCDQDKFIIEAVNYEQITYEELGKRLGVSNVHAWRLTKAAFKTLEKILLQEEIVREYLHG